MTSLVERALQAIDTLRSKRPRVHCITNTVAQNFSANVLLACGAIPSMTVAHDEIPDFTSRADGLLINLGTMNEERTRSVRLAVDIARRNGLPFVLDPVFAHASKSRLALAKVVFSHGPSIVRANMDEAAALFDNGEIAGAAKSQQGCIVVTGESDRIFNIDESVVIDNGVPVMSRITAMGCALTALMAALSAVEDDQLVAATSALLWFNIAGELADENSSGPGTFVPNFIDALSAMEGETIKKRAKLS